MPAEIIGRESELGAIDQFLAAVERGPAALVFSGEAGIGKTILWEVGVEEARQRLGHVLTHRSVEAEASLAFGGLSDLLSPVLEELLPSLAPPRRRALEVALWLAEPGEQPPDAAAIGLAFLDVLRLLAERGPVLVALDDLQWLDSSSALVVPLALRRLRDEPVGLLATLRVSADAATPFELERAFSEERLRQLALEPLSVSALHHLLRDRLCLELTRPELARVQEATAGNPFFALELGRELVRTGTRPGLGQALRVPDSLRELLGGRLARLPGETLDVLLEIAALARPTVDVVSAAHGNRARVLAGLEAAAREGVVELYDSRVRFAHPLLASICYEEAPVWKRRAVHKALAEVVGDVEERARHLALGVDGPDAKAASELDIAADHAAARGAPAAAAELYELAGALTPDNPVLGRSRRLEAARFHRLAGNPEQATALLDELLSEVPHGVERADALVELAKTLPAGAGTMTELLGEALAEAADDDTRSARILGFRSHVRMLEADVHAALVDARGALEKAERVGELPLVAVAIAWVGHAETWAGEITCGLLERGVRIEESLGLELDYLDSPTLWLARLHTRLGELDRARAVLEKLDATAAARGDQLSRHVTLGSLATLEWIAGRWQRALDHVAVAYESAQQMGNEIMRAYVLRVKAQVEGDIGLVEEARASALQAVALAEWISAFTTAGIAVLGRLELALGNLEAARGYLRELPGRLAAGGTNDPTNPVWPDAIETLIVVGELEQARSYLDEFEIHAERLGSPLAMEAVFRCRGLFRAAEGDPASAFDAFERALTEQPDPPWPLERARTLLCLGTVRRQAGQKRAAREALEQALAIFEELGARLWAEKARGELGRISGRRAPSDGLTETERRVAELAARGQTNKQIAAELFIGVSTVEMHLSRVYRKLGVRRTGLAPRLASLVDEAAEV
jgi:DNA-binding CsgD family transcriptional regulator